MNFLNELEKYQAFDYQRFFTQATKKQILAIISKNKLSVMDYLTLLSPKAEECLHRCILQIIALINVYIVDLTVKTN